jgi:hypothetical protein
MANANSNQAVTTIRILLKNVQSIMTDTREEQLFEELTLIDWDVLLLNETWRSCKEEIWQKSGHLFLGAGGTAHKSGVAILVHKRWAHGFKGFRRVSERLCALDLNITGRRFRFVVPYMPTSWHDDSLVDDMYYEMSNLYLEAKSLNRTVLLGGDFNAVIGSRSPGDPTDCIGPHGVGTRNARGQGLVDWACSHQLLIWNTKFRKPFGKLWTHHGTLNKRQIDFCLAQRRKWITISNIEATQDISLGSDHRCLTWTLDIQAPGPKKQSVGNRTPNLKGWAPYDAYKYSSELDERAHSTCEHDQFLLGSLEDKCKLIEDLLLSAGQNWMQESDEPSSETSSAKLNDLIRQRKQTRSVGDKVSEKKVAKLIQKEMAAITKARREARIDKLLTQFRDLKYISLVKSNGKHALIGGMIGSDGQLRSDRQQIADVFADFYEQLYGCRSNTDDVLTVADSADLPPITVAELQKQLKAMRNRKGADSRGIVAELLKHAGHPFLQLVADLFTDVLNPNAEVPESWKQTRLKVLFKKGDPQSAENYRPISIIPILYKLFSKVLCERVSETLQRAQSVDQAGFRAGYSCDDHLFVLTLLSELFAEFRKPLWMVAVDFKKAFDSVGHISLWQSLLKQGVPHVYVNFLQRLYAGQSGRVQTDCLSRSFPVLRGTRQGDPISPILFNAALEDMMRSLKERWTQRGFGIQLGGRRLSNLRFADDLLLMAPSLHVARQMLRDLMQEASKFGLEVHDSKTKIIWNGNGRGTASTHANLEGKEFEILGSDDSTMYLGRLVAFDDYHDVELKHRVGKAWAKFAMLRNELTNKVYDLRKRVKLFTTVIQPSLLYGCVSWTMTRIREKLIRTTQRKMLRQILGAKRRVDSDGALEDWVGWQIRSTRLAEEMAAEFGIADWVEEVHRRKFKWASTVCSRTDDRWTLQALRWSVDGSRKRARPVTRWTDSFNHFFRAIQQNGEGSHDDNNAFWMTLAQDGASWSNLEDDYVNFVLGR